MCKALLCVKFNNKIFFSKYASMPVFGKSKTTDNECLLIEDTIIEGVSINDRADKKDISM